jgi:HSF-type DNA-binding
MYDFHKKTTTDGKEHVFIHPLFQKDNQQALARIKRKKNCKQSSKGSLSTDSSLTNKQRRAKFLEEVAIR